MLTLYYSTGRPHRIYSHISTGPRALSVSRDLGWADYSTPKVIQFHRSTVQQVQEAELFDDHNILMQGGGDGGAPPGADDIYGPGPRIESIHSDDEDPTAIPVPDLDSDSDLEDEAFWVKWKAEILADEYDIADKFMVSTNNDRLESTGVVPTALRPPNNSQELPTWEPDATVELGLHAWESTGYDPAVHLILHSNASRRLNHTDIELLAADLMNEPMEIQLPAMLAYVSFPDTWFTEADIYYEDVLQLDSIVLAVDQQVFAAKKAGAIAAKRMIIATNKTQNNLEASPEEVKNHPD